MKQYPKTYEQFIRWQYKTVMRKSYENPNSFKILASFTKTGLIDSVLFLEQVDNCRNGFLLEDYDNQFFQKTRGLNTMLNKNDYSIEERNREIVALAYCNLIGRDVPDGHTEIRNLKSGMLFEDDCVIYRFVKNAKLNPTSDYYFFIEDLRQHKTMALRASDFKNCTVRIYNFYGDEKDIETDKDNPVLVFDTREDFTRYSRFDCR